MLAHEIHVSPMDWNFQKSSKTDVQFQVFRKPIIQTNNTKYGNQVDIFNVLLNTLEGNIIYKQYSKCKSSFKIMLLNIFL